MGLSLLSDGSMAIIAYAYPAMQTIKVIKARPIDSDESMQWMIYWVAIAALYFLDSLFGAIGLYEYLPLWNEIKLVLLLWMMIPTFQGALWIYLKFVKPIVTK
eukprot:TRINITY_DN4431_c0_g1_i1.p1 TRINITY_DN4431_c0_g1~~TRINITY_DN4431_c0_g1_i1.p1  ORF type:complete len:103 (+),score=17.84 TRINITY_DN4431_c0_g1_i1:234-542(+)